MKSFQKITRRSFLKKSAGIGVGALGFPYIVSSSALGQDGNSAASERITLGFIGMGNRGYYLLRNFIPLKGTQVVAVCDVKPRKREKGKRKVDETYGNTDCAVYNDFRELCARDDIDAVVIASPQHWHGLHMAQSVEAGKDIYGEKALTLTVDQGRIVCNTVRKYKRVFQVG